MPRSSFEEMLAERLIFFPKNVSIHGDVRQMDGTPVDPEMAMYLMHLMRPVAQATERIVVPDPSTMTNPQRHVSPKTILTFSGMPNAETRIDVEGTLTIHLGMLAAFASLPATFELLHSVIDTPDLQWSHLQTFKPPENVLAEVDRLMAAWDASAKSGWQHVRVSSFPTDSQFGLYRKMSDGMAHLVTGHELTHWFETVYRPSEWERRIAETKSDVQRWLGEETLLMRPQVMSRLRGLLQDPEVLDNWTHEVHADCGAFDFLHASSTHGGWSQSAKKLQRSFILIALLFSLLTLLEIFNQMTGGEVSVKTHPPASARRALFVHIQARRCGMSEQEFLLKQFGAGVAVGALMDAIIGTYVNLVESRMRR